jgi:quinol monooxygenase YgiN
LTVLSFERFTIVPDDAAEPFVARVEQCLDELRRAPGALWADLAGFRGGFMLLSEWRTAADLDAWEAGTVDQNFRADIDVYLIGEPTRRRFEGAG